VYILSIGIIYSIKTKRDKERLAKEKIAKEIYNIERIDSYIYLPTNKSE
jgi:hypothetical protein